MRFLVALAALCVSPAIGMDWTTAAAPTPFVTAKPAGCPCGDTCPCGPGCTCPDCPHRSEAVAVAPVGGKPPKAAPVERLAFSAAWCSKCQGLTYPVGVRVVDFDANEALAQACGVTGLPAYVVRQGGKVLRREQGVKTFQQAEAFYGGPAKGPKSQAVKAAAVTESTLAGANVAAPAAVVAPAYRTVVRSDYHVHVCRNCGNRWAHHDSNQGKAGPHRCAACGHYEYRRAAESAAVRVPVSGGFSGPRYAVPVRSNCPGGNCPTSSRSRGLFGGLFR